MCVALVAPPRALAQCQIPCGIYDDHARMEAMLEDAATVAISTIGDCLLAQRVNPDQPDCAERLARMTWSYWRP